VRHIFKPISYLEIQLLSGVSGGYIIYIQRDSQRQLQDVMYFRYTSYLLGGQKIPQKHITG
ncbi:hypothetical protein, partial [Enterobacter cloacae]